MYTFDARRFIREQIGTPLELSELLSSYGVDVPKSTIEKWETRASIPGEYWPILMMIGQLNGWRIEFYRYVRASGKPRRSHTPPGKTGHAAALKKRREKYRAKRDAVHA